MIRGVVDTNVLVSGLGWGGVPGAVVDGALSGQFRMVTSVELLDELRRVLRYPKLAVVFEDADEIVALVALSSDIVAPVEPVALVRDPDDHRVVEAALAGGADVIVSGGDDLLVLDHMWASELCVPPTS